MSAQKPILDACCGSKMFWFDKMNPHTLFCDSRDVDAYEYYPGRTLEVKPDVVCDFTALPFEDKAFKLVVFDPPHLKHAGETSWLAQKYGVLGQNWQNDLRKGFSECFRVLKPDGVLIFKWNDTQIPVSEILKLSEFHPLFGNKRSKTHWIVFMKSEVQYEV